jgi:hypothetical protein
MDLAPPQATRPFSLTRGGPFFHLLTRLRIWTPEGLGRAWGLGLFLWLPIGIVEGVHLLRGARVDPLVLDISTHVRLLFTMPVLLYAERLLDETARSAMASFHVGNFGDRATTDRILARAERMRDSWAVEAVLLVLALAAGELVLWRILGATGLFHGGAEVARWTFVRVWYAVVAFPLVQFIMFRWLWRWAIWSQVLRRLGQQTLSTLATHADRAAGLGPLARPVSGCAGFVLATSAILAGAWGTQVIAGETHVKALLPGLVVFLLASLALALGPLLVFCRHLFRARRRGLALYGDFVRGYTLRFHEKWIEPHTAPAGEQPLGTPDIQSLADLGHSFQVVQQTRIFVFGTRQVITVWFAGIIPMIPLFWSTLTVQAILKRILSTVLGGLPL